MSEGERGCNRGGTKSVSDDLKMDKERGKCLFIGYMGRRHGIRKNSF